LTAAWNKININKTTVTKNAAAKTLHTTRKDLAL